MNQSKLRTLRFSQETLRRLYRAFKAECPTGPMTEENFKQVFAKFFPSVPTSGPSYSHHVFTCLDTSGSGAINFEEFIKTLSLLTNGTLADKLVWIFNLYDVNKDGELCQADLEEITTAVRFKFIISILFQLIFYRYFLSCLTEMMQWSRT